MRLRICFLFLIFIGLNHISGQETIHTSDDAVIGPCGDTLILRGVNYAPFNWGYSAAELHIDEIAKSGANCVRIVWFEDAQAEAPNTVYQDPLKLREVLEACISNGMIPIIELHDQTCQNDGDALLALADWYLQDWVVELIEEYKHSIILNLFNEALHINWTGDVASGETAFVATYTSVIQKIRDGGITVPLMIDGSECGTNLKSLANMAPDLAMADPLKNLIFSTHSYWQDYADSPEEMSALIEQAAATKLPFVIGELANFQDDQFECQYTLDYEYLLELCAEYNMGWMAWSWDRDNCGLRQVTEDGIFENLTVFGESIVNHPLYGLGTNPPSKSAYLNTDSGCSTIVSEQYLKSEITIYPNPVRDVLEIKAEVRKLLNADIQIYNPEGTLLLSLGNNFEKEKSINLSGFPSGIYFLKVGSEVKRFVKF
ncbi:cellulase family glycosylhydrolase [Portibacter lacus]|uniref:Uncharacterized protein n=1 Tax=Portibacter lacus TaxID=1099794 RepID=A0AA37WFK0_9BACT|nr:cellulase family glycosylhydrolase [Portibacter lacus]GLR18702.1 hypothetical protein GCM10007940_33180 [Portibacter lacus]